MWGKMNMKGKSSYTYRKKYNANLAAKIAKVAHEYYHVQITPQWKVAYRLSLWSKVGPWRNNSDYKWAKWGRRCQEKKQEQLYPILSMFT